MTILSSRCLYNGIFIIWKSSSMFALSLPLTGSLNGEVLCLLWHGGCFFVHGLHLARCHEVAVDCHRLWWPFLLSAFSCKDIIGGQLLAFLNIATRFCVPSNIPRKCLLVYRCSISPEDYSRYRIFLGNACVTGLLASLPWRTRGRMAWSRVFYVMERVKER